MFNDVKDLKQGFPQTYRVGVGGVGGAVGVRRLDSTEGYTQIF